jgi:hypothetical protein
VANQTPNIQCAQTEKRSPSVETLTVSQAPYPLSFQQEIAQAIRESKADIAHGRFYKESVAEHIERIKKLNRTAS